MYYDPLIRWSRRDPPLLWRTLLEPFSGKRASPLTLGCCTHKRNPQSYVRALAHCEYENGYLIFDRIDDCIEVWRLASDFAVDNEGASDSPPDEGQRRASTFAAAMHHRHAPRGHFRPWAKLSLPKFTLVYRFAYPTLLYANNKRAFLYDVRTGALVQTINLNIEEWLQEELRGGICYVDVNERHVFVCGVRSLHVFARDGGAEVLRISSDASMPKVVVADTVPGNPFITVLPLRSGSDDYRPNFLTGALPNSFFPLPLLSIHMFSMTIG